MSNFNSGKNIAVVIQLQLNDEKEALSLLKENASSIFGLGQFAYILHDKDVLDNGEIKGKHLHLVLKADKAQSSNNWIKYFSEHLEVALDAVSVEMLGSERKMLRYLLHLDDPAKHQYDRSEVITNMPDDCKKAWEANTAYVQNPTLEQLEEASKEGYRGIYNLVGMASFEKAIRIVERLGIENEYIARATSEVIRLRDTLFSFTSNADYIRKGYIPLKDFEDALRACSSSLEYLLQYQEMIRGNKK